MREERSDASLLQAAALGDEEAFRLVYERHRLCIFQFAYRMTNSIRTAEEIVHDCFLALMERPRAYRPERSSLRTYLWGMARNLSMGRLRKQFREIDAGTTPEPVSVFPVTAEPLHRILRDERARIVCKAIAELTPLQREVVILFEYHELSLAEIAAIVGTEVGTIKSRLHRARGRLRKILTPRLASSDKSTSRIGIG